MPWKAIGVAGLALAIGSCAPAEPQFKADLSSKTSGAIVLTSKSFSGGQALPARFAADHGNASPDLSWSPVPGKTKSLALILVDPDAPKAGGFVHWLLYNLSPEINKLPSGLPMGDQVASLSGALQGRNDRGSIGYFGPQPPPGRPHHYHFRIYALDLILPIKSGATRSQLERAMSGHVLAQGELVATYAVK